MWCEGMCLEVAGGRADRASCRGRTERLVIAPEGRVEEDVGGCVRQRGAYRRKRGLRPADCHGYMHDISGMEAASEPERKSKIDGQI